MAVKASVSISEQQEMFARRLVEDGRYPSVSAVVQRGLELVREETELKIVGSIEFGRNLDLIHDHLIKSYIGLGDAFADAFDRAEARIEAIEADLETLAQ